MNEMEMNVGLLKELISELPDDTPVFVGCAGSTNYDFENHKPVDKTDTFAIIHDGKLFITDENAIEIENGNTI